MILEVGRWALSRSAEDSRAFGCNGTKPPRIAVNVSALQLRQKDFVGMLNDALGESANGFDLEITESLVMQDIEANIGKLSLARKMGLEVAVDAFGTGYSSLSYIARLPVNALKIDRSFIVNMTRNSDDLSIVSTIIALAHSLGMKVIAEGVETREQAVLLKLLRCDEIQGYLFSPAVPPETITRYLCDGKRLDLDG
ncbi:MAG: EAL domain-containing protein [Burkholderiales bacterium]|nr:EAL domain-containing protein [Burkholderiales bacterium]